MVDFLSANVGHDWLHPAIRTAIVRFSRYLLWPQVVHTMYNNGANV